MGGTVCPACARPGRFLFSARDVNRQLSEHEFDYWRCPDCELIFLDEIPLDPARFYGDEYYAVPCLEDLARIAASDRHKLGIVQRFHQSGRLCEIGPAFGVFAYQAKQAGFTVTAIEMDARCCEYLGTVVRVNVINSDAPHVAMAGLPPQDVIAAWHVIEHLPEPFALLEGAARALAPGGVLILATPNPAAFQLRMLGSRWPHVDAPRHRYLLPASLLTRKAEALGFERVFLTADDADARRWNRFGWQRMLMNGFSIGPMQKIMWVLGYALSVPMALWDRRDFNGSAYTLVLRKPAPR